MDEEKLRAALDALVRSVDKIEFKTSATRTSARTKINAYANKAFASGLSRETCATLVSLFVAIADKRRDAQAFAEDVEERRAERIAASVERRESKRVLYVFEALAVVFVGWFGWFGLNSDVDAGKFATVFICATVSLIAFFYFHVGEYGRVDRIVRRVLRSLGFFDDPSESDA